MTPPPVAAPEIPKIISVDDHVIEPPDLWTSRLPAKFQDRCPRIERDMAKFHFVGGVFSYEKGDDAKDGAWGDWWMYDDLIYPMPRLSAAACIDGPVDNVPVTFDEINPSGYKQKERLEAMDANHVDVSLCFPNILPRFCGQAFLERDDKELALLCVKAYNDWMIEEWCGGDGYGRLIPLTLIPLWDPIEAAAEVRRCAALGSHAVAFSENPYHLGLPSIHDVNRFWEPFLQACEDTETVINMHIGSSSKMPSTSPDAPFMVSSTLTFSNAMGSMCDWVLSGTFVRFPKLKIAYSEGQVGWMPYVMERMDKLWEERGDLDGIGTPLPEKPTSYLTNVFGCVFDDEIGLRNRDVVGMDQIMFETDFPHLDSTFPHTLEVAQRMVSRAGLSEEETYKLMRGNAIKAYGLERFGITK